MALMYLDLIFPPGATRRDWVLDAALAAGLGLLTIPPYGVGGFSSYSSVADPLDTVGPLAAAILMVGSLVLRRHAPLLAFAGVSLAGLVQLEVSDQPMATLVAVPVVAYSVARWVPGHAARIVVAVGGIGAVVGPMRWVLDDLGPPSLSQLITLALAWLVCMGLVITPYAVGRRVRESSVAAQDRVAAEDERYRILLVERAQEARLAESRARAQIARELHDIVAHSLSVMIVQAEGGKAIAPKRPEVAVEALSTIAETGREALTEMRRIVGVLREGTDVDPADFAPAPHLEDIPDLVQRTSDRADLLVRGRPPRVSRTVALTAYRVVQEALTNFLKHAGSQARAQVTLTYRSNHILIEVADNGSAAVAAAQSGSGHGLRGMRERVTSMGGQLATGARAGGGFLVRAVLPIDKE